jgi:hypothetical protein
LYLTVELARQEQVRAANQAARRSGLPVVDGEVIWEEPEEAEGPWHQGGTPTTTCSRVCRLRRRTPTRDR